MLTRPCELADGVSVVAGTDPAPNAPPEEAGSAPLPSGGGGDLATTKIQDPKGRVTRIQRLLQRVSISARIRDGVDSDLPGTRVTLWRKAGSRWVRFATTRTNSEGKITWTTKARGRHAVVLQRFRTVQIRYAGTVSNSPAARTLTTK